MSNTTKRGHYATPFSIVFTASGLLLYVGRTRCGKRVGGLSRWKHSYSWSSAIPESTTCGVCIQTFPF